MDPLSFGCCSFNTCVCKQDVVPGGKRVGTCGKSLFETSYQKVERLRLAILK